MKKILIILLGIILLTGCTKDDKAEVVPAPPENLTGEVISTTAINLTWTDRSANEIGFKIERKLENGTFEVIGTTATDITTFSDTGLIPGATYVYRVYSFNEGGKSLVYSNELKLTTNPIPSIAIYTQTWATKNFDTATYSDGTPIPQVTDPTQWASLTTGAWCYYDNDPANGVIYGKLYNWYAVAGIYNEASKTDASQRKNLAPKGWHVPSNVEWTFLVTYLGNEDISGGKMKATGTSLWQIPNSLATNSSGFTGLPGGYRLDDGTFRTIGSYGSWWSSLENGINYAKHLALSYNSDNASSGSYYKKGGFSVRCLKD